MRRLWLLRHAKSSWDDPSLDDHERPLAPRGRRDAAAMATHVRGAGVRPDLVLCSSAVRARDTLTGVMPGLGPDLRIVVERSLYTFEPRRLADALAAVTDRAEALMLVGHNPAIQGLAERLASDGEDLARLHAKYPTCALATIDLEIASWADLASGAGRLVAFVTPRDLALT
jgi:phosphohistidine phosphatase